MFTLKFSSSFCGINTPFIRLQAAVPAFSVYFKSNSLQGSQRVLLVVQLRPKHDETIVSPLLLSNRPTFQIWPVERSFKTS